ncbi:MAG: phosphoglycerate dehydrogenase [Candidatus Scalindua sp. AMX11]|nr:MAG: phosphoglycerate dehydrogenase [Candidatus Scalindua sp.]NOG82781.1 phosphoglycerate dehydrogenase [Planctomycetota bacterium]RZV95347.1 MAG: phosphoglycerate dehydrogenase [Candidatus Scalindua sp. SCAELEC01]TDE66170.1 MAG: phosphoglycerate dehydrogenase [Candidatus Scalindua sp. AMX11]GJQ57787.1 MAG: D-3-phosphoglycerate dehydrogenase [Candidatus Scalindua sp.]
MKVLISDKLSQDGIDILNAEDNLQVTYKTGLKPEELQEEIRDAEALIIRSATQVTKEILTHATKLKIIGRAGIGVDNVDCDAATERGIVVVNTPSGNATTTAEHTIAMLMSLSRHIPQADKSMHQGQWEKSKFTGTEVTDKILGIFGFGNIGMIVADRAKGLKMRVLVSDPFLKPEIAAKYGVELVEFDQLCKRSDYITVHVPLNDSTRNLIDKKAIESMKTGVRILNCARGGIVNEADLVDGLNSGKIAGAAIDVFEEEPPKKDNPLSHHDRVVCTPHLGASTTEAQVNVAVQVAEQIRDYAKTGEIRNALNFPSVSAEVLKVLKPYLTLCSKLGAFQGQIFQASKEKVRKLTISYSGSVTDYDVGVLTSTIVHAFLFPILDTTVNYVNALSLAKSSGIEIEENHMHQVQDYANQITFAVHGDEKTSIIAGALFGKTNHRFVRFNNFHLEVVPDGYLLVIHNNDRPGVVGKIGTILSNHKINISRMHLTLGNSQIQDQNSAYPKEAVIFVNIDQPTGIEVIEELKQLNDIISVYQITLN